MSAPQPVRFAMVAGEASGDLLGAGLIDALREHFPDAQFAGVGGPRMIAAGMDAWYPAEKLSVMGLIEVLPHLLELLAMRRDVARRTLVMQPNAFIGIDAPDFNLGLERKLKNAGIRTVHYVSPSVWAWKEKRAAKIGRSADRVLCLFPMEPPIYARYGVDARFVGHPLADSFALDPDRTAALALLGLSADAPVLAVLPGSRLGEIAKLGADFLATVRLLAQKIPDLQVVAPMANAQCHAAFVALASNMGFGIRESGQQRTPPSARESGTSAFTPVIVLPSDSPTLNASLQSVSHQAMLAADAILLASGTAALEGMLAKRPMTVGYRVAPWTYRIVKGLRLLKVTRYALPNVLAGRDLVPEFMQDACTPQALADALLPALRGGIDPELLAEYRRLHLELRHDASRSAAAAIADLVATLPSSPLPQVERVPT